MFKKYEGREYVHNKKCTNEGEGICLSNIAGGGGEGEYVLHSAAPLPNID